MEKGLKFFTEELEAELENAVAKFGSNGSKEFKLGWLKSALAWERWENQNRKETENGS
tara:strand:- start:362 stop:535 length:174 start_codon:yes stop_codon:yes gene_type:complete